MFAPIYSALGRLGIGQTVADDMELWVIAGIIGADDEARPSAGPTSAEIIAARVAAAKGQRPPPVAPGLQISAAPVSLPDRMR